MLWLAGVLSSKLRSSLVLILIAIIVNDYFVYIAYINPSCSAFITAKKGNQFAKKQQLVES